MQNGIRKGLEDVAWELKGIKNVLSSLWHDRHAEGKTNSLDPDAYADEYLSTEECARRLNVSDQTIRNWIAIGRKNPEKGWVEGIHYVNVMPDANKKALFRIPWTRLVQSFSKNREAVLQDFYSHANKYQTTERGEVI